jgi:hypothetical protein
MACKKDATAIIQDSREDKDFRTGAQKGPQC